MGVASEQEKKIRATADDSSVGTESGKYGSTHVRKVTMGLRLSVSAWNQLEGEFRGVRPTHVTTSTPSNCVIHSNLQNKYDFGRASQC